MPRFIWPLLSVLLVAASLIFLAHPVVLVLAIANLLAALYGLVVGFSPASQPEESPSPEPAPAEESLDPPPAEEAQGLEEEQAPLEGEPALAAEELENAKDALAAYFRGGATPAPTPVLRYSPLATIQCKNLGLHPQRVREIIAKATRVLHGNRTILYYEDYRITLHNDDEGGDTLLEVQQDTQAAPAPERPRRSDGGTARRRCRSGSEKREVNPASSTPLRPIPGDRDTFFGLLADFGFTLHRGSKHHKITHPQRPGVAGSLPTTPSSQRWIADSITFIRHQFQIDLRQWDIPQATAPLHEQRLAELPVNKQTTLAG
ncbi:hypothetical protein [Corynebacterium lowii]|uniref:Uncharacterized protein n=1 Tax=Corynebacterium lowii TaxID=1544413 RepID=A0A0Q0UDJ4_9CORY|nr:hypothetical protein [Corynebacterium lowii]KQB85961.1 hypothetical protein Clow_01703 [Corynebacterium lowii]MDP9850609.1 hypothetical protein [Corynebacterium lowii]